MFICIECSYPVPQTYRVLHSTSHAAAATSPFPSTNPSPSVSRSTSRVSLSWLRSHSSPALPINSPVGDGADSGARPDATSSRTQRPLQTTTRKTSSTTTATGTDVRLVQCPRCKRFADKYVEHDFVVKFIDLVLVKPQVYRHLLFNQLGCKNGSLHPSIVRLGILLLLFDVYLKWSAVESLPSNVTAASPVPKWPLLTQYLFFLLLSMFSTLAQHLVIRQLASLPLFRSQTTTTTSSGALDPLSASSATHTRHHSVAVTPSSARDPSSRNHALQQKSPSRMSTPLSTTATPTPSMPTTPTNTTTTTATVAPPPSHAAISTALFVSSCMRLFPILMVVWRYDDDSTSPPTALTSSTTTTVSSPHAASATTTGSVAVSALSSYLDSSGLTAGNFDKTLGSSHSDISSSIDAVGGSTKSANIAVGGSTAVGGATLVAHGVAWAVAVQNLEALRILLGLSHLKAALLVAAGRAAEALVTRLMLGAVGLAPGSLGWGGWSMA